MSSDWRTRAACRELSSTEADWVFFPPEGSSKMDKNGDYTEALTFCNRCPVREECLATAMAAEHGTSLGSRYGMFGGLSPRERWARSRDDVVLEGDRRCVWCDAPFTPRRRGQLACSRACGGSHQAKQTRKRAAAARRERGAA